MVTASDRPEFAGDDRSILGISPEAREVCLQASRRSGNLERCCGSSRRVAALFVRRWQPIEDTLTIPSAFGSSCHYSASMARAVAECYGDLEKLEQQGYDEAPGNLELALRSFMATYDRYLTGRMRVS